MNFYEAVAICAKNAGTNLHSISKSLGHSENYISNLKSMGRITSVENAARILEKCGYSLCAVPNDELAESMLEITPTE